MSYRNCPVCDKETPGDRPICEHCKKGVFVFDFEGDNANSFDSDRFRPVFGEICGWHDILVPSGAPRPKPPREWRCFKKEPEVFARE